MSFTPDTAPSGRPDHGGALPGRPAPYFLPRGEGEHAKLFGDVFTVLVSGDESGGRFGVFTQEGPPGPVIPTHAHRATDETFYVLEGAVRVYVRREDGRKESRLLRPGDFAFVPAGLAHAYRVEEACRMIGTATGGFERFFAAMGTPTERPEPGGPPFVPDSARVAAAAAAFDNEFLPDVGWSDVEDLR